MSAPICTTCGKEKVEHRRVTGLSPSSTHCDAWCPGFFFDPPPLDQLREPYVVNAFANPAEVRVVVAPRVRPFTGVEAMYLAKRMAEAANLALKEFADG